MKNIKYFMTYPVLVAIAVVLIGCAPSEALSQISPTIEEHALEAAPQSDPLAFVPQDGTQEDILQAHASERSLSFQDQFTYIDGNPAFSGTLDGKPLVAQQIFINSGSDSYVLVTLDGVEIYRIATGPASPITTLRGLWIYDNHWAMETVLINLEGDDIITPYARGQVTIDGVLQNDLNGYDEAFALQTIAGRPFFFYKREGKIGYSYDGQETMLEYDEIVHYACCSESALNPTQAQNMVAFFARSGDAWCYVEIGSFSE